MGLLDNLLNQASGGNAGSLTIDQMLQGAPTGALGKGLAEVFRSEQTPPIGELVGQLFGRSNGQQQAGMLNQLLAAVGPAAAAALAGGALGRVLSPGQTEVTPDQAAQISSDEVQQLVDHAHDTHPGVAEQLGSFYAQHAGLINSLGSAALAMAMAKASEPSSPS